MKLLYFHAKDLQMKVGLKHPPTKQRKIENYLRRKLGDNLPTLNDSNRLTESRNALLVFVCAEKGDEAIDLTPVTEDIIRARALLGVVDIVIGAFGHLSNQIAEPALARQIIDNLAFQVRSIHPSTKQFPFGWDKSIDLHIPCHHFNTSFKSYPV
ncbi:MAG: threonyl-tRNA synthetase editing domain-containing protein [Candidatus Micrarchaeota archaeon]